jgi:macrolide-specific efflux system membrane fusion protein
MNARIELFVIVTALIAGSVEGADQTSAIVLPRCRVALIEDVEVPAQEAGQLVALHVREGLMVEEGSLMAQIDDSQPQHLRSVADLQRKVAQEEAESDVRVRYAKASAAVAAAEYKQVLDVNRRHRDTVPKADERRKLLAWESAELQIEHAQFDQHLAALERDVKAAEVLAADDSVARRRVQAPLAGLVIDVPRNRGEWVQPGDTVVRLIRIDRVRVEGFLSAADYGPATIAERRVTVRATLPEGAAEFPGSIAFVSPLIEAGQFLVRAEVDNRDAQGQWLLRPGLSVELTIEIGPDAAQALAAERGDRLSAAAADR